MNTDKINVAVVNSSITEIANTCENASFLVNGKLNTIIDNLKSSWDSDNAVAVNKCMSDIANNLTEIRQFIMNVQKNVSSFATSTSNVDAVTIGNSDNN